MSEYNSDDSESHITQNSHIDKLIEIDNLNAIELLTPSDVLENIQMYDSTVEIVGYVDNIESPRCVGSQQQYKFFKFYLNNGKGKRVQIVAWNNDIDYVEPHIKIIHLDGTQARPPKIVQFNNGNMPYELLIKSNTTISNLGKFEPMEIVDTTPEKIELSEVLNATKSRIMLRGYVKTNFAEVYNNNMNKNIGCGAITDGTYKLEIHIINFSNDDYFLLDIKKGDHVEIIGIMQTTAMPFGQVPVVEVDGKKIAQSVAICRYLAKQYGLAGKDDWESLEIDSTVDTIHDLRANIAAYHYEGNETAKEEKLKRAKEIVPYYLERLDAQVQKNGGYFVGGALSWADFTFVGLLDYLNFMMRGNIIEKYDNLKQLKQKIEEIPSIKSWIEKRPSDINP